MSMTGRFPYHLLIIFPFSPFSPFSSFSFSSFPALFRLRGYFSLLCRTELLTTLVSKSSFRKLKGQTDTLKFELAEKLQNKTHMYIRQYVPIANCQLLPPFLPQDCLKSPPGSTMSPATSPSTLCWLIIYR